VRLSVSRPDADGADWLEQAATLREETSARPRRNAPFDLDAVLAGD